MCFGADADMFMFDIFFPLFQLSAEWGVPEVPEFPGESVSEDEYKKKLR